MKQKSLLKVLMFLAVFLMVGCLNVTVKFGSDGKIVSLDNGSTVYAATSTIVNSAYDTSGNGGRKLVRLSNGWLISVVWDASNCYHRFYKSTDNGLTWSQMCYASAGTSVQSISLASNGTTVYALYVGGTNTEVRCLTIDTLTVTNTDKILSKVMFDSQASFGSGISVAVDSNGYLHVVYCSKNTTYPNSFNIRYSKSMDGGVTWATPTQISTINTSGQNYTNPCIIIKNDNKPIILAAYQGTSNYLIICYYYSTAWNGYSTVYNAGSVSYAQANPCAVIDSNDNIHVVWNGTDSTDTLKHNIRYNKSTDGGVTWGTTSKLTSGNAYDQERPSITIGSGNLYVFFQGRSSGSYNQIRKISYNGSWGNVTDITSNTTNNACYPNTLWSKFNMNDDGTMRWIYQDVQTNSVRFDSCNYAPLLTVNSPNDNVLFTETTSMLYPVITVTDADNDTLTCKVYIDSSVKETRTVTNSTVNFNSIDTNMLAEGIHTVKFEVSDGIAIVTSTRTIKVDRSSPNIGVTNIAINDISINISSTVTDSVAGLDTNPYRFTIGNNVTAWTTTMPYTQSSLIPNTLYTVKIEAKDSVGHIATYTQNIETKANQPTLVTSNITKTSVDVAITDQNPAYTYYQVMVGGRYLSSNGNITARPTWITIPTKNITVKGLESSKSYSLKIKARNNYGIQTPFSSIVPTTTLANPTTIPTNLTATSAADSITLAWDASDYATSYDVEVDGSSTYVNVNTNKYTHSGLNQNTTHTYRVRGNNSLGSSKWSSMVSAKTLVGIPSIPSNITANEYSTSVVLNWDTQTDCTYEIEADGEVIENKDKTTFIDKNLLLGTQHTYRVRSKNSAGTSEWSTLITKITKLDVPAVLTNIKSSATNNSVTISWDIAIDATGYDIKVDGVEYSNDDATSFTQNNLAANTSHTYMVRAKNSMGTSNWSNLVSVTTLILVAPTNITNNSDASSITLSWTSVQDATGYDVEVDGVVQDNGNNLTFTHNGLTSDTEHKYRVRAKNGLGTSAWSEEIVAYSLPIKPSNPTNIYAIAKKDQVILTWNAAGDSTGYQLEVDGAVVDNGTDTKYIHNELTPNTEHTYRVRAINDSIEGDWSNLITLKTLIDKIEAPENVVIRGAGSIVTVNWDSVVGATGYDLEVDGVVKDMGNRTSYTHRRVNSGIEHIYRIRSKNNIETSSWSGQIVNNSILAKGTKGQNLDLGLTASDVTDFSQYALTVWYDKDVLDVTDLCELTKDVELTAGEIKGTDITVSSFTPGKIVFTVGKEIPAGESWTGVINSIKFKAKLSGGTPVNYVVNIKPDEEN